MKPTANVPASIDQVKQKIKADDQKRKQEAEERAKREGERGNRRTPFDLNKLQTHWNEIKEEVKKKVNDKQQQYIMDEGELSLQGEFKIVVKLNNRLLLERFRLLTPMLYQMLSSRLKNDVIEFEATVGEAAKGTLEPYTSHEKYEYLLEKFPLLSELRDKLGLEVD
ncbi:hypothetical protein R9C00_18820 [Flammeovirgaceae bacterium SG7u.111]|nr:hypothetical protein [Flammeovirgaceae bacterium SG7u.132]WPO33754.1 hypothetical protein R9C00_18820 [Flammeovirgaceae bacterium SG7u.111]